MSSLCLWKQAENGQQLHYSHPQEHTWKRMKKENLPNRQSCKQHTWIVYFVEEEEMAQDKKVYLLSIATLQITLKLSSLKHLSHSFVG